MKPKTRKRFGTVIQMTGIVLLASVAMHYIQPILYPLLGFPEDEATQINYLIMPLQAMLFFGVTMTYAGRWLVRVAERQMSNPDPHMEQVRTQHRQAASEAIRQQQPAEVKKPETVGHVTDFERGTDVQELPEHIRRMTDE
jgi:hypothetical protein